MNITSLPHCIEKFPKFLLNNCQVQGHSISTERTGFYCATFDCFLDAGLSSYIGINRIFVTHAHSDHIEHICSLARGHRPVDIYCPREMADSLDATLRSFHAMYGGNPVYTIVPCASNDSLSYKLHSRQISVEVFQCVHTVPTVGYGFSEWRQKLIDGVDKTKVKELREQGVTVTELKRFPALVYLCDTSIQVFQDERVFEYSVIMIECTFWSDEYRERADACGHIGWFDLESVVRAHPDNHFAVFHPSKRHTWSEIKQIVADSQLSNVTVLSDE